VLVPAYGVHEDLLEVEVDGANALGMQRKDALGDVVAIVARSDA